MRNTKSDGSPRVDIDHDVTGVIPVRGYEAATGSSLSADVPGSLRIPIPTRKSSLNSIARTYLTILNPT